MSYIKKEIRERANKILQSLTGAKEEFTPTKIVEKDEYYHVRGRFKSTSYKAKIYFFKIPTTIWRNPELSNVNVEELKVQIALGTLDNSTLKFLLQSFLVRETPVSSDILDTICKKLFTYNEDEGRIEGLNDKIIIQIVSSKNISDSTITWLIEQSFKYDHDFSFLREVKYSRKKYNVPYYILEKAAIFDSGYNGYIQDLLKHPKFNKATFLVNYENTIKEKIENRCLKRLKIFKESIKKLPTISDVEFMEYFEYERIE